MMPKTMAHAPTSHTWSGWPPRSTQRRLVSQIATRMPAMMHSAYARIGSGPRYHTLRVGLGIEASTAA